LQKLKTKTALIVRCVAPALLGTTAPLDPANPPKEPVTLTVQPSGTLVVRLEGPGNIVDDSVRLRVVGERQPAFAITRFDPATARATYPRVGLGATFTISLERGVVSLAKREVPGPRTPGETIEVVFDLEKDCGHLCARILDPEGKALAETVLRTEIGDRRARIVTTTMKTDAEGRVRIPVPEEFAKVPITWARIALQEQRGALVAKPATPIQWTGGDLDLGDLRCAEAPLIVAGRLVDDDGKPVRGGELGLTQQRGANWKDARNEWLRILTPPQVDAVTQRNEDGSFEIRGTLPKESSPKEPVLLLARHPEFAPQPPIEFKPGQKDVAIVLTRGGEVRAEFLCASQSVVKQLQVTLRPETGNKASELGTSLRPLAEDASRARAGWSRIPEGRYELIVRSQQSGERIHSLAGIAVPRTGTASDPRLGEIDLRPLAQHYTVQIVDASGAKAQVWGSVSFESPEGKRTVQLSDGTATFASGARGIETTVQAQGLRTKTVHLEPGETKVTQSPGLSVVVRCDEIAELHNRLIGNRQIGALLRRIEKETSKNEWDDWNGGSYSEVGKGGESRFALSEPGAWTFSIIAWGGNDGGNQLHLTTFEPTILSVKDEPGEQVFTLKLKPDAKKKLADWLAANPR